MILQPFGFLGGFDADAQAFITAAGITNGTQIGAINTLVKGLKGANLWTKFKALYPMVGGTATTHKFNLKDPRDLNAAFRLQFFGGLTHSATGILPNGTNGYMNTFLNPSNELILNNTHISVYHRTETNITKQAVHGVESASGRFLLYPRTFNIGFISDMYNNTTGRISVLGTSSKGFLNSTRTSINSHKILFNSNILVSQNTGGGSFPNNNFLFGCQSVSGTPSFFSDNEIALASIGEGLTDQETLNFYNIVQNYQTTLGRQV